MQLKLTVRKTQCFDVGNESLVNNIQNCDPHFQPLDDFKVKKVSTCWIILWISLIIGFFMLTLYQGYMILSHNSTKIQENCCEIKNIYKSIYNDNESFIKNHLQKCNTSCDNTNLYTREKKAHPKTPLNVTLKVDSHLQCDDIPLEQRFDCFPISQASYKSCIEAGCCWRSVSQRELSEALFKLNRTTDNVNDNIPFCFYPKNYNGYRVVDKQINTQSIEVNLKRTTWSLFPNDIMDIKMMFIFETPSRLRIKIYDPSEPRYEVPIPVVPGVEKYDLSELYKVQINDDSSFKIIRKSTNEAIFNSQEAAPLTFADQFLQISTQLSSNYLYGLGQHLEGLVLDTLWHKRVLWNLDQYNLPGRNLYGSHPFYLNMEPEGNAHGFLLLNSNALEVLIQPSPALTFRTTGGILDMYMFLGPTPQDVIIQYTDVIGKPFLPPYWSLGYHQCKFGYKTLNRTRQIWKQTKDAGIPFDVQWNDIDYMDHNNDFTYDKHNFKGLPEFVDQLHQDGMHYIPIIDPGISASEPPNTYPPFDEGLADDIFIKNQTGQPFIGKVWNTATTTWPDFTHPHSLSWWMRQIQSYHDQVQFDGAWIDMNEPSNFLSGESNGCASNTLNNPPYLPNVHGGVLYYHTVCMDAQQFFSHHYDLHNLYSFTETIATNVALTQVRKKRPFIISRASFPGQGHFGGHWTGDVVSNWDNLWLSISDVLNFNMFGIPMVGADICGFNGNTTASLCLRWMQLGAFYPFSRNHNTDDGIDQDPVSLGESVVIASRQALQQRYRLLPYLYSLFFQAYQRGTLVAQPLFFKFSSDQRTYTIDTQFMWGDALMIIPALKENITEVEAYLPTGIWYDWYSGSSLAVNTGTYVTLPTPYDSITLTVFGGHILPLLPVSNTTTQSRQMNFELVVALDEVSEAYGFLHWDDGDSLDAVQEDIYTSIEFICDNNKLYNKIIKDTYRAPMILDKIIVLGVKDHISYVRVNDVSETFEYDLSNKVLSIFGFKASLHKNLSVEWR